MTRRPAQTSTRIPARRAKSADAPRPDAELTFEEKLEMVRALDGETVVRIAQAGRTPARSRISAFDPAQRQAIRNAAVYGHAVSREDHPRDPRAVPGSTLRSLCALGVLELGAINPVYLLSKGLLARCVARFREVASKRADPGRGSRGEVEDCETFGVWWYTEATPRPEKLWAFAPKATDAPDGPAWQADQAVFGFRLRAEAVAAGRKATCGVKPGDLLYFVREVDPPREGLHTWRVRHERVAQVRLDGFRFERLVGFAQTHKYAQLGSTFHGTPQGAVAAFAARQRSEIETLQHKIAEAERAIAWADAHPDGDPGPGRGRRES